jgi:3-oxoacyl-[acyl-carrier protein] reductase
MGIGHAVAHRLATDGWQLLLVARGEAALCEAAASIPGDGHEVLSLDVADPEAWQAAAPRLAELDGVVHAAAIITPIGPVEEIDPVAFVETLRINVGGLFCAVQATLPALRRSGGAFIGFSGGGATGPQPRFDAYAASKAATARLIENLARDGVRINAVAPGFVATRMAEETVAAGRDSVGESHFDRTVKDLEQGGTPPERAAALIALLLSERSRGISGKVLSAQWDPWEDDAFLQRLRDEPDLATIRRIDDQFFRPIG